MPTSAELYYCIINFLDVLAETFICIKKSKVIILYLKIMGILSLTHSCLFKHKSKVFESKSSRMQTKADLDYTNDNLGKLFLKTVILVSNDATFNETVSKKKPKYYGRN